MRAMSRLVVWAVVIAFLVAVGVRITGVFVEFPWGGCATEMCCPDCDEIDVVRVVDGDTFVSGVGRIRLFGMDTPEVGQRCAREATDLMRDLAGNTVRVEPGPRLRDRYDRLLFYVYTDGGDSIDETLVRRGLARAWTQDGQHREFLVSVETEARERGGGCLW